MYVVYESTEFVYLDFQFLKKQSSVSYDWLVVTSTKTVSLPSQYFEKFDSKYLNNLHFSPQQNGDTIEICIFSTTAKFSRELIKTIVKNVFALVREEHSKNFTTICVNRVHAGDKLATI